MPPKSAPRRTAAKAVKEVAPASSYRGAAGLRRMKEEEVKAEARKAAAQASMKEPFRFYVKPGQSADIIIVDEAPDFFRTEHALMNPRTKRFNLFVPCIDEHTNCPACAVSDKPAYFAMYLTVIDLTPFTNGAGEEVEWTKKIMVVKATQQKKIMRLYEKHGTLRGMELTMTRDGDMDAAIGNDIEFQGFVPEEELQEYVTEYTDKEKKVHEVFGDEPFDYEDIYPDQSEKEIAALVGGRSSRDDDDDEPAPRRSASRRASRNDDEEEEEEAPRRPSRSGSRAAPTRASRRPAAEEVEEEDEEEAPAPRRSARRAAVEEEEEPAPRRSSRRAAPVEEEEEEDAPAPRRSSRRAAVEEEEEEAPARPARRAGSSRAAPEPLPEEEEEDEPAPRSSRTAKRANLRGTRR